MALLEATDDSLHLARAHLLCGDILMSQDRAEEAGAHFDRAERLFGSSPEQEDLVNLYRDQARRELVPFLKPFRDETSAEPPPGIAAMSRWSHDKDLSYEKLRPELVAEVAFDQVTGHRIRHGAKFVRWRPDKPASKCTFDQLTVPPNVDLRKLLA